MIPTLFFILLVPALCNGQYASTFEWFDLDPLLLVNQVSAKETNTSNDEIWSMNLLGKPLRWSGSSWQVKTSGLGIFDIGKQVSASPDGWAWMVDTSNDVHRFNPSTNSWSSISGGGLSFKQVSARSKDEALAVATNGSVYRWTHNEFGEGWGNSFLYYYTAVAQVSIASDGAAWMVDTDGKVNYFDSLSWGMDIGVTSPAMQAVHVQKAGRVVAVESTTGTVYKWNGSGWTSLGFASSSVSITEKKIYAIDGLFNLVGLQPQWALLLEIIPVIPSFDAREISVRGSEMWALAYSGPADRLPHRNNGTAWVQQSTTSMNDLAAISAGDVWGCNATNVLHYTAGAFSPVLTSGFGKEFSRVASGSNTTSIALTNDFYCYVYDPSTSLFWTELCASQSLSPTDVAMGVDGSLFALRFPVGSGHGFWRWNGTSGTWSSQSATSLQIDRIDAYSASRLVALYQNTRALYYWNAGGWRNLNILGKAISITDSKIYFATDSNGVNYVEF